MNKLQNMILKSVATVARKSAIASSESMSTLWNYEPKVPTKLLVNKEK